MTNNPSTYALTKSVDRFPQYPLRREGSAEPVAKPNYPIQHRSRRQA